MLLPPPGITVTAVADFHLIAGCPSAHSSVWTCSTLHLDAPTPHTSLLQLDSSLQQHLQQISKRVPYPTQPPTGFLGIPQLSASFSAVSLNSAGASCNSSVAIL